MAPRIALPDFPISGGCACGAVRYEVSAAPMAILACCCGACQKITASAFSLVMPVMREHLQITLGQPASWIRTGGSGAKIPQRYCRDCGSRLFTEHPSNAAAVSLRPGTLDDTSWIAPVAAIYMAEAQPWTCFPDGTLLFDKDPDDPASIAQAWRAAIGYDRS